MSYQVSEGFIEALRTFFKSNTYTAIRLIAGITTLLILFGYQYLPQRTITVLPDPKYPYTVYSGDNQTQGTLGKNDRSFSCTFKETEMFSCGLSVTLASNEVNGLNLKDFSGIIIHARYKGDATRFRITMRNHNPAYSQDDPVQKSKYLLTLIRVSDFDKPTFIKLSEFSVAEWWIRQYDVPREHTAPDFSNTISIGFDFVDYGQHELELEKVELVGVWLSKEALYLAVLLLWMFLIIWDGVSRFFLIYIDSKKANQKINEMTESYKRLEIEKKQFETLSTTDVLTGITNRAGIDSFVRKIFESNYEKSNLGIIIFDIDHFKKINDTYGHDVGDHVLQGMAKLISANIRGVDVFGRWGGEEFIIIAPQATRESLIPLAEKLRNCVELHNFDPSLSLKVTISMGVTSVKQNESFESALKRADMALYSAKNNGRNRVLHSPEN